MKRILCLRAPSPTLRPPLGKGQLWRLISHLSLNYLSLVDGKDALQEILRLYNFSGVLQAERQISAMLRFRAAGTSLVWYPNMASTLLGESRWMWNWTKCNSPMAAYFCSGHCLIIFWGTTSV